MGRDLAESFSTARYTFEEVDDALGQNLTRIIFEGPDEDLRLTSNVQPALMAVSLAIIRVLETEVGVKLGAVCSYVAGHSLGEYSALTAAGSMDLVTVAQLLRIRGAAMQKAVPLGEGAMAALLGLELDAAVSIAADAVRHHAGEVCEVANDNAFGQVVLSGGWAAVGRAIEIAKINGARRAVFLPVSAPFHCSLMKPAALTIEEALEHINVASPLVPLIANVSGKETINPKIIRRQLVNQVTGMVRWRESVLYMQAKGVDRIVEVGAGNVLSGLIRRIDSDLTTVSIKGTSDIEAFVKGY